jgi:hypothetical protein
MDATDARDQLFGDEKRHCSYSRRERRIRRSAFKGLVGDRAPPRDEDSSDEGQTPAPTPASFSAQNHFITTLGRTTDLWLQARD